GLKVEFFVDKPISFPEPPPNAPPLPPEETYGHFDTPFVLATTDAQGIARSGPFTAGTVSGTYDVAAPVFISFYAENLATCRTVPALQPFLQVAQAVDPAPVPAWSPASLLVLSLAIASLASVLARGR